MKDLSIVIAAYNEEKRLPATLEKIIAYMKDRPESYEILIVNDGSKDATGSFVRGFSDSHPEVRMLEHFPNKGRGASIREGVLAAEGCIILETDADNSVANEAIGRCLDLFKHDPSLSVVFGSREMRESIMAKYQPFLRVFLGKGFIYLAKTMLWMWDIRDFTLGFKMFRREAAMDIFAYQYDNFYTAEAEVVFLSRKRGWKYKEVPVTWTDSRDSKINPLKDSIRSFMGMVRVLRNNFIGKYK